MSFCSNYRILKLKCLSWLLLLIISVRNIEAKTKHKITCTEENMIIELEKPGYDSDVYLDNLKYYPDIGCHPVSIDHSRVIFNLTLNNFNQCGITRITNQMTKIQSFYQKIIIEEKKIPNNKEIISFKCSVKSNSHKITTRDILPTKSQEENEINLSLEEDTPIPIVNIGIKKGNLLLTGENSVKLGTPLTMEIYLDNDSAPIYGLSINSMNISDFKSQQAEIIFNGCFVDKFLFENFKSVNGDYLSAKFKAFSYPYTTIVQFTGTVNVCLDKCPEVECRDKRTDKKLWKRETNKIPYDGKKIFEVTFATYLRVEIADYLGEMTDKENAEKLSENSTANYGNIVPLEDLYQKDRKTKHKVSCTEKSMIIELEQPDYDSYIYLENLKYYPNIGCHPEPNNHSQVFNLSLDNFNQCGITRITNQITGIKTFYQRIIIEDKNDSKKKEIIGVKCSLGSHSHNITRRNVLPAGFKEQEDIEITTTLETNAPEPILKVGVKQGNALVNGELNVKPGTPLTMEIYLDKESAPIYGLLVSFMRVSDTKSQEETIIFNGCSVDPYLFENFNTVDGDYLSAKFRAFKFPETTYVQFTGTVNICLDKCTGIECSNGQTGYGRRKREIRGIPYDPKKVFEVTLTTYLKVDYKEDSLNKENPERIFKEKQFFKNYTVLTLNDSHIVPLEDLYERIDIKSQDDEHGKQVLYRAETEEISNSANSSITVYLSLYTLLLTTLFSFKAFSK